jgi:hypothetical protein
MRLAATVTANLLDALDGGDLEATRARPALEASLFGRASDAVRTWSGGLSSAVDLEVVDPGKARIARDGDGTIHLALPLEWVVDVWGRELAVVGARLALALVAGSPSSTRLTTVGWDLAPPRDLIVELL